MQMQLSRERSFSSPTISTLITQDTKSPSQLSNHSSGTTLTKSDVSQSQNDNRLPNKTAKKALQETTPDQIENKTPKEKSESVISEVRGSKSRKGLRRCSTFPRSKVIHAEELSAIKSDLHDKKPVSENPTYQHSVSVPHSFGGLKPALKGSRSEDGVSPRSGELRVRWAPDVYDPPVTSVSHAVRAGGSTSSNSKAKKKGKKHRRKNNNKG